KNVLITFSAGIVFLIVKTIEYTGKYHHGIFPGTEYFNSPEFLAKYKGFFGLYYCMTGLHALHVIVGMAIMLWIYSLARKNRFSTDYYTPVELGALYWHLVDLIWIYLFPLLYLV
ncbi:MAG: cytochrome c oxidase subunit 3, partial [Bdellovibrionales bacterium]|nr:cytochrome c oxidase subunit 3 [Bdellovibrionales bacterium]